MASIVATEPQQVPTLSWFLNHGFRRKAPASDDPTRRYFRRLDVFSRKIVWLKTTAGAQRCQYRWADCCAPESEDWVELDKEAVIHVARLHSFG